MRRGKRTSEGDVERLVSVPPAFAASTIAREGPAGRTWIASLPRTVEVLCDAWNLEAAGPPRHGYVALVVPVRRDGRRLALKISWIDEYTVDEATALRIWDGRGAVRLLDEDPERGALLLEWLDPSHTLNDEPIETAAATAGRLLRRLAVPLPAAVERGPATRTDAGFRPDADPRTHAGLRTEAANRTAPARRTVDALRTEAGELADFRLAAADRWEEAGRPFDEELLARSVEAACPPASGDDAVLVNTDLHYENVLRGKREPWLVIDPKVVLGRPEYGVAPLLWNRFELLHSESDLAARIRSICEEADLDLALCRKLALVRTVDYWLWALEEGLTEDPARCRRLVSWLRKG